MAETKKTAKKEEAVSAKTQKLDAKNAKADVKNEEVKTSDFVVLKTGGKQYIVSVGSKIKVEKLPVEEGKEIEISEVLLKSNGNDIKLGNPFIEGAKVKAKVVSQFRDDKIVVFKYKKRKNYRRKQGHRQSLTALEIVNI